MKRSLIMVFTAAFVLYLVLPGKIQAQDWPQFAGMNRDCKVTGFKAPKAWPAELKQTWKVTAGTGDATPLLVGNRIYLHTRQGNDEVVLCLDAKTGKEIWKTGYAANPVTGPAQSHPGPRSTPAMADGKIVTFGVSGILSCLDITTGKIIWRKDNPANTVPQFFTGMSPLLVDGMCIAHVGTKDNGTLLCLDLATGNEKWKWAGDGPAYASPMIMKIDGMKTIVLQTEKNLMGFNLNDGKVLWQLGTPVMQRFYNCSSPCINGQIVYLTGQGSGIKALKIEKSGDQYVTKELWSNANIGAKWNTPVLRDGFLYGFTDKKTIYCINASDGQTAWNDITVHSDFATLVDCGEVLIGLAQTGNLIVFKPVSKEYLEVARYKVAETAVYTFPVVAGNAIYIKDAESLMQYSF